MELWSTTVQLRRSVLSTFEDLEDDDWDVASLCKGWAVRDVLAHLILAARPPAQRYIAATLRARGDFDKANHALAVADGTRPPSALISDYRAIVEHRFSPPGWPAAAPLSDVLLHTHDVRIPLGRETNVPAAHYEPALDLLLSRFGRSFTSRGRPNVRWTATDHSWSRGNGPEVRGTMAALTMTAAGRAALVSDLDGDGVAEVRTWLG